MCPVGLRKCFSYSHLKPKPLAPALLGELPPQQLLCRLLILCELLQQQLLTAVPQLAQREHPQAFLPSATCVDAVLVVLSTAPVLCARSAGVTPSPGYLVPTRLQIMAVGVVYTEMAWGPLEPSKLGLGD